MTSREQTFATLLTVTALSAMVWIPVLVILAIATLILGFIFHILTILLLIWLALVIIFGSLIAYAVFREND